MIPPAYGEAFRRGVTGAELVTVPAAGTWSSWRRPSPSWRRWRGWTSRARPPAIAGGAAPRLRRSGRLAALPSRLVCDLAKDCISSPEVCFGDPSLTVPIGSGKG